VVNVPVLTVLRQDPIVWRTENARPVLPMPTVELWMEVKPLDKPLVRPEFVPIRSLVVPTPTVLPTPTVTRMADVLLVPLEPVAESTMVLQELIPMVYLDNPFAILVFVKIVL